MNVQTQISIFNENYFFKEFTYIDNKFSNSPRQSEVEIADNIVALDDLMMVFQIKERNVKDQTLPENEGKWFENKVLKVATRQIRDTLSYFKDYEDIELKNQQGHSIKLKTSSVKELHKIIIYLPHSLLPDASRQIKYHQSRTAGVIHIFSKDDYLNILQILITPAEIAEYLQFRENLILKWGNVLNSVCEAALVGQYLSGRHVEQPNNGFIRNTMLLDHRLDEWNVLGIIQRFQEKITYRETNISTIGQDYYEIIKELAKLMRFEFRVFKERLERVMKDSRGENLTDPYRMIVHRLDCGFVFIPCIKMFKDALYIAVREFTILAKYDQHLTKCIGIIVLADQNKEKEYDIVWCYLNFPWEQDE